MNKQALIDEINDLPSNFIRADVISAIFNHIPDGPPVPDIEFNKLELRAEEADCVEAYLDSIGAPKHDSHCDENMYSLVGRIANISAPPVPECLFDSEELNLLRQWYNAMQDNCPQYITEDDGDLQMKIAKLIAAQEPIDYSN